jgi:hypothetical protein
MMFPKHLKQRLDVRSAAAARLRLRLSFRDLKGLAHTTQQLRHLPTSPLRLIKRPIFRLKNLRIGLPIFPRL